jgi:hypothetical protein
VGLPLSCCKSIAALILSGGAAARETIMQSLKDVPGFMFWRRQHCGPANDNATVGGEALEREVTSWSIYY